MKIEDKILVNGSYGISTRGTKRSAEEGEKEKTEESNTEKRGRQDENDTGIGQEKVEDEKVQKEEASRKELIEEKGESSDNSHSETSIMDLSDDDLIKVFAFLDLPTRLNLRVNKRLDGLYFSVKTHLKRIIFDTGVLRSHLKMNNRTPMYSSNCTEWETELSRLAKNTIVDVISITVDSEADEDNCRIIDVLFHFNADVLVMNEYLFRPIHVPHLTLSSFLTLVQNVRSAKIDIVCTSLSAQDLCTIRKFQCEMDKAFIKECFGVTVEHVSEPVSGTIYTSQDSIEIERMYWVKSELLHFGDDLQTKVDYSRISFKKLEVAEKPDDEFKLRLNHAYEHE